MQVVERQDERALVGQVLEQAPHRPVHAEPLVGERAGRRRARAAQRRQDGGQLVDQARLAALAQLVLLGGDVGVQRVDPDAEGQLALELGGGAGQHQEAALLGAPAQLAQQLRLADPRLALDGQEAGRALAERVQRGVEASQLGLAPDGRPGAGVRGHPDADPTADLRVAVQGPPLMILRVARSRLPGMWSTSTERQHMQQSRNIAARAGRWSARHRKIAVIGWLVFVVLAFVVGGKVGTQQLTDETSGVGESGKATQIHAEAYPKTTDEMVLVSSDKLKSGDPEFRAAVADVTEPPRRHEGRRARSRTPTPRRAPAASPPTATRR